MSSTGEQLMKNSYPRMYLGAPHSNDPSSLPTSTIALLLQLSTRNAWKRNMHRNVIFGAPL